MEFLKMEKTRIHRTHIRVAIEEALKSGLTNKHGAVIVKRNKIISKGHNRFNWSPHKEFSGKWSLHAEIDAINNIGDRKKLRNADIYVVRLAFDIDKCKFYLRYSAPCDECYKKLKKCMKKYGLRNVYFSDDCQDIDI